MTTAPAHDLGPAAAALRVLLPLNAVLAAAMAFLAVRLRVALDESDVDAAVAGADARDALASFLNGATVFFLSLVVTGVLFVVWMWRAARNNEAFGRPGSLGSAWAVGGWFLPVASLVLPAVQLQQLWRGSDPSVERNDPAWRKRPASVQLWCWWVAYVLGQGLMLTGFTFAAQADEGTAEITVEGLLTRIDDVRLGLTLFVAGQALLVLAAILGSAVVVRLTARQVATAEVLGGAPAGEPAAPAGWHPDPTGRADQRWWDGRLWTDHVIRDGAQTTDEVDAD